jgi:chromosome partitioning protein
MAATRDPTGSIHNSARSTILIIAVVSSKGGVGKTTSTVSLAAALARIGHRVLLVDLDSQASASLSVGLDRGELHPSSADVLLKSMPAQEAIRATRTPGLDVLPASVDLTSVEGDLGSLRAKELMLRKALERVREDYDFVLVDCPPGFGLLSRNALAAADGYLVPTVPQFLAVEGVEALMEAVDRLSWRCQQRIRLYGILPTVVDLRTRTVREMLERLRAQFGNKVFAVEVRINVRLAEAPALGKTIFEHDPTCVGAHAYELLAEELLIRLGPFTRESIAAGHGDERSAATAG